MKNITLSLTLAVSLLFLSSFSAYAQDNIWQNLESKSAVLVEELSGEVLMEKDPDVRLAPASITKIMTLLLIMEELESGNISMEDMVLVSPEAKIMGGSEIWLEVGEQMSVEDMIKAITVASANDASVAMAEHISGTEAAFVDKMNNKAKSLEMHNTNFMNSHGLDEDNHYTTANDIVIMTRELLKHEEILDYTSIWIDYLRDGETELVNTNRLIRQYAGATGLKTGTTDNAGHSLVVTANKGGLSLIAVTLGSTTSDARFNAGTQLLNYGFANFCSLPVPDVSSTLSDIPVLGGKTESITPICLPPEVLIMPKSEKMNVSTRVNIAEDLYAPVEKGQHLGEVQVLLLDEVVCTYDIVVGEESEKLSISDAFIELCKRSISAS